MNKSNYTNLKETYFNGKTTDRINFYSHYKNDENTIDDPIFTGFTFDIDMLHSPLFYTFYESDGTTLKGGGNTDLANKIENHLKNVYRDSILGAPNSYEINTLSSKDTLGSHNIGYGKQDRFYLDNVIYSATDYIYMVDKNISTGSYSDEIGFTDVGNGTPDSSVYDTYQQKIDENTPYYDSGTVDQAFIDESTLDSIDVSIDDLKTEIEEVANSDEHKQNEAEKNTAKSNYDTEKEKYDSLKKELETLESDYKNQQTDIKSDLSKIQEKTNSKLVQLKNNPSSSSSVITEINSLYEEYNTLVKNASTTYDKLEDPEIKSNNKTFNTSELSDTVKEKYNNDNVVKTAFDNIEEIISAQVISSSAKTSVQSKITDLQKQIKEKSSVLYGEGKSEGNADENSLYGKYTTAKNKYDTDTYAQKTQELSTLQQTKENYKDTQEYSEYKGQKTTTTKLVSIPSISIDSKTGITDDALGAYTQETEKTKESKTIYEVPQTVYDMLGFIDGMKKMTTEYPYVMQSVTGLDEAYKKYFVVKDPHMGSGDDKITISCYESLDLRVSSMFNKYFNATYDHQYRRERIPVNLRRFQCSVFVHDIRNFRHALESFSDSTLRFNERINGDDVESKLVEMALNYMSAIEFKFYDCEIVPEETGTLFDNVSNETGGEMKKTNFTFTYGNCVINFLPFEDLKKYYRSNASSEDCKSYDTQTVKSENLYADSIKYKYKDIQSKLSKEYNAGLENVNDSNFRRWFDKSELGNVNNNDYRDYIRHSTSVEVDDTYKTSIVNNFALNSVTNKQEQLNEMDDALRKIVVGISASTGIPVKGVTDALNIGNIYNYINKGDGSDMPIVKDLGNVTNSTIIDEKTTEYKGEVINDNETQELDIIKDLGKIST